MLFRIGCGTFIFNDSEDALRDRACIQLLQTIQMKGKITCWPYKLQAEGDRRMCRGDTIRQHTFSHKNHDELKNGS